MDFSLSPENVSAWREGHVMNDIVFNLGCCCPGQGTEEVFSYIEVIYKDGNRHYFYENQTGFDRLKKISTTSVLLRSMSSGRQKKLPRRSVIFSLFATMCAAQKVVTQSLALLKWMN
mgnify:CR=1 FL=1